MKRTKARRYNFEFPEGTSESVKKYAFDMVAKELSRRTGEVIELIRVNSNTVIAVSKGVKKNNEED